MNTTDKKATDIYKVPLFMGIEFWAKHIIILDKKIELICKEYKFGKVNWEGIIRFGKFETDTYGEEIRIKRQNNENPQTY